MDNKSCPVCFAPLADPVSETKHFLTICEAPVEDEAFVANKYCPTCLAPLADPVSETKHLFAMCEEDKAPIENPTPVEDPDPVEDNAPVEHEVHRCLNFNCTRTFTNRKAMIRHFNGIHEQRWKCDVCGKVLASGAGLREHERTHQ